ncbi:type II toxin-antitoxin system prevent-host-death family antitoxin [bacterium endosymbiont of Escarpia laminata]|nr:MAG: type II toxin-antitoxin system prevent-host-death family antitoxin [bacterium endosymbiont of Escarpia laminata]RLJ21399.1 MAG: type II toxin-antitoxin system prevent-host-death family antitoxin [bacterium endosymbiont of Escarpia laminata]
MQVNVHQAKSQLSKLIERALAGEEVIIARNNKPTVRLEVLPEARDKRRLGALKGLVKYMANDFDDTPDDFKGYL